jgi:hypothetical protein
MRRLLYQAATLFLLWAPRLGMAQHLPGRGAVDSAGLITPGTCLTLRFTDATTAVQWCPTATNAGEWRNASGTAFLDWDTSALTLTARQLRLEAALPFTQAAGSAGDIIINSGATPSPGLKFYTAGDTNFAIRGSSATLQFVYKLGETGATTAGTLTSSGEWTSAAAA